MTLIEELHKTFFLDSQGVRCYECNSSWPACGNPPNFNLMQYTRVTCTTACATWINPNDRCNAF